MFRRPESFTLWKTFVGFASYILTQMVKFSIIATLLITLPICLDLAIDCVGMYLSLSRQPKAALTEVKVLSVAVGWSIGESILTRVVNFYVNARAAGFDLEHLTRAAESNISLLQYIATCALLYLCTRPAISKLGPLLIIGSFLIVLQFSHQNFPLRILTTLIFAIASMIFCSLQSSAKTAL